MSGIHWKQAFSQKLSNSLRVGGCQRGLRIALTNDFEASEATADDMRNKLMKIPKCMLVIVLTGTFEHSPVTEFQYWTYPYYANIKLNETENIKLSKKYDGVVNGLVKNEIPSSYYQYKLKDKNSSQMLLNNLETSANIPNEMNLLRLNQETGYTIPELKRDNIDHQHAT